MINAIRFARENKVPYFGICLGMQTHGDRIRAQRVRPGATPIRPSSTPATPHRVIYKLRELKGVDELGGTMRLGAWPCVLAEGSFAQRAYGRARDQRAAPPPLRVQPRIRRDADGRRACGSRARRRTAPTSRSARSRTIPGTWAASSIPSSSRSPWSRTRCSGPSSARPTSTGASAWRDAAARCERVRSTRAAIDLGAASTAC